MYIIYLEVKLISHVVVYLSYKLEFYQTNLVFNLITLTRYYHWPHCWRSQQKLNARRWRRLAWLHGLLSQGSPGDVVKDSRVQGWIENYRHLLDALPPLTGQSTASCWTLYYPNPMYTHNGYILLYYYYLYSILYYIIRHLKPRQSWCIGLQIIVRTPFNLSYF